MAKSKLKRKHSAIVDGDTAGGISSNSAKAKSNKAKASAGGPQGPKTALPPSPVSNDDEDETSGDAIDEVDLEITLEVLKKCISQPSLLSGPAMKPLRTALHLLKSSSGAGPVAGSSTGGGDSLINQISTCLRSRDWSRALLLLEQLRTINLPIKLGTLQRWVRDCDSVAASGVDPEVYVVIDKIMRVVDRTPRISGAGRSIEDVLSRREAWAPEVSAADRAEQRDPEEVERALEGVTPDDFRVCLHTPGADRLPPNLHPAIIHASRSGSIPLTPRDLRTPVQAVPVPSVPGATFLKNVFSIPECKAFVRLAEQIGMLPDEPVSGSSAAHLQSVLAANFYWLADDVFINELFERIRPCLSERVDGGRKLTGINRRFRLYRYTHGSVYRPHIDGAWPPSGLDPKAEEGQDYVYDVSPPERKEWSRFTLLIYLNEGFQGGCTTFFTPNTEKEGMLDAWPVRPVIGCAMIFPHGVSDGSLVHEGSGVEVEGHAKYIIRTDVLYTTNPVP
ncbi:hypothetical protein CF319_g6897 [Tilletia indica]|nr:hypothetical protein CF319_g6897 [Tilletia indica]KAE8232301.1 hypothetical protein CF326_g2668 [Tilletia indica]